MEPETLTVTERTAQLHEWEASRKQERFIVLIPVFWSFLSSFFIASTTYAILTHWCSASLAAVCALIAGMIPLAVWLASYLQTWGSYVERLLEDIESKIDGRCPVYYRSENGFSFSRQPLHERLQRIEAQLAKDADFSSKM